jgi:tRNA1(Val) A37 N6-methylase TrmN6
METTEDQFLGGKLTIRQLAHGYRAGLDAVILAAACPAEEGPRARCLDCGAGAGVAGLALARRVSDAHVTLVEHVEVLAGLATENAAANGLRERAVVVVADLTKPLAQTPALAELAGSFDQVIANPPYHSQNDGTPAAHPVKAGSHAMAAGSLDDWVRFAAAMTRADGQLTLIHRAAALAEVLFALDRRFGRVRVLPLHPREGAPASRILVSAVKGSRAPLELLPGRILHRAGEHKFMPEFEAILRNGQKLNWDVSRS